MKENLLLLGCLAGGVAFGASGWAPALLQRPELPMLLLSFLVLQVGVGLGSKPDLRGLLRSLRWPMLLLPVFTIVGTLLATLAAGLLFRDEALSDLMAAGSGFGYYSLSSLLIVEAKTLTAGAEAAARLGAIALLANIIRELLALFGCAYVVRRSGGYAAISVAGACSMDVCLPAILRSSADKSLLPVAMVHGLVLEVSVPLLVTGFCH